MITNHYSPTKVDSRQRQSCHRLVAE